RSRSRSPPRLRSAAQLRLGLLRRACVRSHDDAACADCYLVPPGRVSGVSQLVDFEVAPALETLLRRGQHDRAVHDRLLDTIAAELICAVGNVGREEPYRANILDDRRELEDLGPYPRRVRDL